MDDFYEAIYLSPHFDDVALSCGGQIFDLTLAGKSVLIVTVMAGDPIGNASNLTASEYVQSLHDRWQLQENAVQARKAEDTAACDVLGADWQHWRFLDCIYRLEAGTNRPFYTSDQEIFGEIDPAEIALVDEIAEQIRQLPPCNRVYAPLTLGHHVDHQLTRLAAEACFPGNLLTYYEDYPYARQIKAPDFLAEEMGKWEPTVIDLSAEAIEARIKAIRCFESQVSTFFENEADLAQQVNDYVNSVGGERVWKRDLKR